MPLRSSNAVSNAGGSTALPAPVQPAPARGAAASAPTLAGPFLLDGHVHFYRCYRRDHFLDHAVANFARGAEQAGLSVTSPGWLLFTETSQDHFFRQCRAEAGRPGDGRWSFRATAEGDSLFALRDGIACLILVAGRQIVTRQGLEVLALGTDGEFRDGASLEATLDRVRDCGAIPVVPWGFGKWSLSRRRLVANLLRASGPRPLFLGDNGGRPALGPRPGLFRQAEAAGVPILPGSDPLPFRTESGKAGRYGFVLEGEIESGRPAAGLRRLLLDGRGPGKTFGRRETLPAFCWQQIAMQLKKRRRAP